MCRKNHFQKNVGQIDHRINLHAFSNIKEAADELLQHSVGGFWYWRTAAGLVGC